MLLIFFSRTIYPSTSIFLAPDLPLRLHTMARMVTTTVVVLRQITSPPILDSPSNLIYHPTYTLDPHARPRRQATLTHLCTRRMMSIQSTAGRTKSHRQRLIRLGLLFRPRSPYSTLIYPTCPNPQRPPKVCIHLTQTPVDPTALALASPDTIALVLTYCRPCPTQATNLVNW